MTTTQASGKGMQRPAPSPFFRGLIPQFLLPRLEVPQFIDEANLIFLLPATLPSLRQRFRTPSFPAEIVHRTLSLFNSATQHEHDRPRLE